MPAPLTRRGGAILAVAMSLDLAGAWAGVEPEAPTAESLIAEGLELGYNFDRDAFDRFDELIRRQPADPRGYFLKAAGYFWYSLVHPGDNTARARFREFSELAVDRAEARLEIDADDVDALFFRGAANGNLGRYYGLEDSWLKAFWLGRKGKNTLLRVVEIDPEYHDAYLGLGIYHYYAAVLPKVVRVLSYVAGIRGDRQLGLQQLERAATRGSLARTEARFFLGQLYHEREQNYEASQAWMDGLVERFPDNGLFRIYQAGNDFELGRDERVLRSLSPYVQRDLSELPLVESRAHHALGRVHADGGRCAEAIEHFRSASAVGERLEALRDWAYARSLLHEGECLEWMGNRLAALAVYARIPKDASASAHEEAQGRIASPLTSLDLAVLRWRSLRRRDRHADALQVLQAARAQSADDVAQYPADELPRLYYRIGETLLDLSDPAAARQEFERVLAAVPDRRLFSWAQYQLGRCHRQLGRDDEAEAAFRSASVHADEDLQRRIDAVRNAGESSHGSPG